jgi:NADH-quinone oxidoreductase subunit N
MTAQFLSDLGLLLPEMILIVASLILILVARRTQNSPLAMILTVLAAIAGAFASIWLLSRGSSLAFGGMIVVDGYSQFFKVVVAATLGVAALLSVRTLAGVPRGEYHALLLLASSGMMLTVSARDLLPMYLGLELMTLCSYILVGIRVERPASNEAAIKYFLLGSFASALLIYGISLTYGVTGTTDFAAITSALASHGPGTNPLLLVAIGLVGAGLAFKIAAVPLHSWAPDAYQGASAPVAAFLAAGSKAVGLAALGRVALAAYGSESQALSVLLAGLAGLSIIVGSVIALSQTDMKRLLAYSSIAHAGYALLGLIAGTPEGVSATMTYAFFYVFMTLGTFGVVVALGERGEGIEGFRGLAAQRPGTAAVMLIFLMSLTGIPPTAGFAAKFVVILSAVRAGYMPLAVLAVACSVVSAFFYMRIAVLMYMNEPQEAAPSRLPAALFAAIAVAGVVTLIGGITPGTLLPWTISP